MTNWPDPNDFSLMTTIIRMEPIEAERVRIKLRSLVSTEFNRASSVNSVVYLGLLAMDFDNHVLYVDGLVVAKDDAIRGFIKEAFPMTWEKAIAIALAWGEKDRSANARHPSKYELKQMDRIRQRAMEIGLIDEG